MSRVCGQSELQAGYDGVQLARWVRGMLDIGLQKGKLSEAGLWHAPCSHLDTTLFYLDWLTNLRVIITAEQF